MTTALLGLLYACGGENAAAPTCVDLDSDGYGDPASNLCAEPQRDCVDSDAAIHPGADEICDNGQDDDCDGTADGEDADCQPPLFSFAVLADPHITATATEHQQRLSAAVDWINDHTDSRRLELVLVVGDIGWGEGGTALARELLDQLAVPYVPIIGDNEIQTGWEEDFDGVFGPHYAQLATRFDNWSRAPTPVANPATGAPSYLQNVSFDHRGVHFMGLDWCTRTLGKILGEQADLNDFLGGSFEWFRTDLEQLTPALEESVIMASHHPMYPMELGAFSEDEYQAVAEMIEPRRSMVYANLAGHFHNDVHHTMDAGFELYLTDATWDDVNTVRLVEARTDGVRFRYRHELIVVP